MSILYTLCGYADTWIRGDTLCPLSYVSNLPSSVFTQSQSADQPSFAQTRISRCLDVSITNIRIFSNAASSFISSNSWDARIVAFGDSVRRSKRSLTSFPRNPNICLYSHLASNSRREPPCLHCTPSSCTAQTPTSPHAPQPDRPLPIPPQVLVRCSRYFLFLRA